jgi:hypothetical protein
MDGQCRTTRTRTRRFSRRRSSSAFRIGTSAASSAFSVRDAGDEVEFVKVMMFDSLDAVREFAGTDFEEAVVPPKARAVLSRFDERSQHYQVKADSGGE